MSQEGKAVVTKERKLARVTINLGLAPAEMERLDLERKRLERSLSWIIRQAVREWLDRQAKA